jgi:hypothetical protein
MHQYFVLDSLFAGQMTVLQNRSCLALDRVYLRGFPGTLLLFIGFLCTPFFRTSTVGSVPEV